MKRKEKKKAEGRQGKLLEPFKTAHFLIFHLRIHWVICCGLWPLFRRRSFSSLSIGIRNTPRRVIIFSPSAYSASSSPRPTILLCEGRRCGWKSRKRVTREVQDTDIGNTYFAWPQPKQGQAELSGSRKTFLATMYKHFSVPCTGGSRDSVIN